MKAKMYEMWPHRQQRYLVVSEVSSISGDCLTGIGDAAKLFNGGLFKYGPLSTTGFNICGVYRFLRCRGC